jgi:hypothetical protein
MTWRDILASGNKDGANAYLQVGATAVHSSGGVRGFSHIFGVGVCTPQNLAAACRRDAQGEEHRTLPS